MRAVAAIVALFLTGLSMAAQNFHSDPSCWDSPRIYHPGPPSGELARKIERTLNVTREPRDNAVVSPNGAYKTWVEIPHFPRGNVADQILYVFSEEDQVTRFYIEQAHLDILPQWINEKLVFARVMWGREVFTDIIIDAESGNLLYQEEARVGRNAFEQYKQVCGNTCPCNPQGAININPPKSIPGAGEAIGVVLLPSLLNHDKRGMPGNVRAKSPVAIYLEKDGERVEIKRIDDPADIETIESGYEFDAATVYAAEPGWYRIGLRGGIRTAWVREQETEGYTPMTQLLIDHLAYLDEDWDGRIWASPDGEGGYAASVIKDPGLNREEYAAEFLELRNTQTGPWLRVRVHDKTDCGRDSATIINEGWVPAWSSEGKLAGKFYSRGC